MALPQHVNAAADFEREVRREVEGHQFGETKVRKLLTLLGDDADGEIALHVVLVLENPETPTWPLDDTQAMRLRIRELSLEHPPGMPFYVKLTPEHEEPQADDDDEIETY